MTVARKPRAVSSPVKSPSPPASLFGAVTPFCSCSSIPLFIGFVKGGIPLGVTFSFLITSPLVNEVAVAMFLGSFGVKAALIYVASGILLGAVGGAVLGRFRLEPMLTPWVRDLQAASEVQSEKWNAERVRFVDRLNEGRYYVEYDLWVRHAGTFASGIGILRSVYAPEFRANTPSVKLRVAD